MQAILGDLDIEYARACYLAIARHLRGVKDGVVHHLFVHDS